MRIVNFIFPPFPAIKKLVGPSAPPIIDTLPASFPISASPIFKQNPCSPIYQNAGDTCTPSCTSLELPNRGFPNDCLLFILIYYTFRSLSTTLSPLTALTLKFIFFFQAMKISYLPQPFLSIMDSRKQYSLGFLYSISSFLLNPPFLRDLSIVIGSVCSFLFQCILST